MEAQTTLKADQSLAVDNKVTAVDVKAVQSLRLGRVALEALNADRLVQRTEYLQVGWPQDFSPGTSALDGWVADMRASVGLVELLAGPSGAFLQTKAGSASQQTASWITLDRGTWTVLARFKIAGPPHELTYRLVAYTDDMDRAGTGTSTAFGSFVETYQMPGDTIYIQFEGTVDFPVGQANRVGLEMEGAFESAGAAVALSEVRLSAIKVIPA